MKKSLGAKTILYPLPVLVVGTYDRKNNPNVMTVAWGGICCSIPPCVAISLRKATYSYKNLIEKKAFTISIPSEDYVKEADYFGIISGSTTNKFKDSQLTPVKSNLVDAPYVKEFPVILECKVIEIIEIGLHVQFIGEILDLKAEENCLNKEGLPDIVKIKPLIFDSAKRVYVSTGNFIAKAFFTGKDIK